MSTLLSIARPYALAAFDYARDNHQLPAWKIFLESASMCVRDESVSHLLTLPKISSAALFDFFYGILESRMNEERKNFLLLLANNKRLILLPEIADLFNAYFAALEKICHVRVVTAVETQEDFRQRLTQALKNRMQREVTLKSDIDPSILGGAVIHIGDRVIDGSIRGKLTRLLNDLTS